MALLCSPFRLPAGSLIVLGAFFGLFLSPSLAAEEVFHYFDEGGTSAPCLEVRGVIGFTPFKNMTGDGEVDWVGHAMTSALAEMVEKAGGRVRVVERDESEAGRKVRGGGVDLAELEKRSVESPDIQAVLRGEFRRSTRGVYRFSCSLERPGEAGEGRSISECGSLDEILEVQGRLSEKVCAELGLEPPAGDGREKVGVKPYEYYQRALSAPEGSYQRLHYCLKALEEDADYVSARFSLAEAYYLIGISYGNWECLERALKEYRRVVVVDPRNACAYYKMGMVFFLRGDYSGSRRALERALVLSPEMAEAKVGLKRLGELGH